MSHYIESLVSLGFLGGLMWGMLKFMLKDIHRDLVDIRSEIHELKQGQARFESRMDKTDVRIDHLYQICIDLLRDRK